MQSKVIKVSINNRMNFQTRHITMIDAFTHSEKCVLDFLFLFFVPISFSEYKLEIQWSNIFHKN